MTARADIYQGRDPREQPIYGVAEAARYLRIAPATLRSWVAGRTYPTRDGRGFFEPLIHRPLKHDPSLSFNNLIEAHVLRALRTKHGVPMKQVRQALDYAQAEFRMERLLLSPELRAAPGELFLDTYGELVSLSKAGQLAIRLLLEAHLERVERDEQKFPARLYPFTGRGASEEPKRILIDPQISFGKPVLVTGRIKTAVLAERIESGESIEDVARDYELSESEIKAAILYEQAA